MLWTYPNLEYQGGFIDTSSGRFIADPHSVLVSDPTRGYRTPDQPYLYGNAGDTTLAFESYDQGRHRWLPVPPQYVSPDGASYAFALEGHSPGGGVHLVDVATGADRVAPGTAGLPNANYFVVGYTRDGVYLDQFGPGGGAGRGLWRLDPATNAITQASTDASAVGVFVGETPLVSPPTPQYPDAWWNRDPGDPYIYHQYLNGAVGQHAETWFQRPGFRMTVIGVDTAGHAIVVAESSAQVEVWLLSTPSSATELYTVSNAGHRADDLAFKTAVADRGGWWIGSRSGVFFAINGTFTQVSTTPAVIVGACE